MSRKPVEHDPIKDAETAVYTIASQLVADMHGIRANPTEVIATFKEHSRLMALAALELIAYHTSPEEASQIAHDIASHYPDTYGTPAIAS